MKSLRCPPRFLRVLQIVESSLGERKSQINRSQLFEFQFNVQSHVTIHVGISVDKLVIFGECNFTADSPIGTNGTVRFLATTSLCLCEKTLEHFTKLQQVQLAQCGHLEPSQLLTSDRAPSKTDFRYFHLHSGHCGEISMSMSRLVAFHPHDSLRKEAFCRNFKLSKLWKSWERVCFKKALNSILCARFLFLKAELSMSYLLISVHEWGMPTCKSHLGTS